MAKKTTKKAAKKAVKKTTVKKVAKKTTAAKKTTVKKAATKKIAQKAPAKKKAAKKLIETRIVARVDVGFGNSLYLRGEGAGLNWEQGALMENISPYEWAFTTTRASSPIEFKCLVNDQIWADGENQTVAAGGTSISSPVFHW